jgi:hypothetical protein
MSSVSRILRLRDDIESMLKDLASTGNPVFMRVFVRQYADLIDCEEECEEVKEEKKFLLRFRLIVGKQVRDLIENREFTFEWEAKFEAVYSRLNKARADLDDFVAEHPRPSREPREP